MMTAMMMMMVLLLSKEKHVSSCFSFTFSPFHHFIFSPCPSSSVFPFPRLLSPAHKSIHFLLVFNSIIKHASLFSVLFSVLHSLFCSRLIFIHSASHSLLLSFLFSLPLPSLIKTPSPFSLFFFLLRTSPSTPTLSQLNPTHQLIPLRLITPTCPSIEATSPS